MMKDWQFLILVKSFCRCTRVIFVFSFCMHQNVSKVKFLLSKNQLNKEYFYIFKILHFSKCVCFHSVTYINIKQISTICSFGESCLTLTKKCMYNT